MDRKGKLGDTLNCFPRRGRGVLKMSALPALGNWSSLDRSPSGGSDQEGKRGNGGTISTEDDHMVRLQKGRCFSKVRGGPKHFKHPINVAHKKEGERRERQTLSSMSLPHLWASLPSLEGTGRDPSAR